MYFLLNMGIFYCYVSLPDGTCLFESAFNQHKPFNDFGTIDLIAFLEIREAPPNLLEGLMALTPAVDLKSKFRI